MAVNRQQENMQTLAEANVIQDKTLEVINRIRSQAAATEETATMTLNETKTQGTQMASNVIFFAFSCRHLLSF